MDDDCERSRTLLPSPIKNGPVNIIESLTRTITSEKKKLFVSNINV